jgi:hypothetical protein
MILMVLQSAGLVTVVSTFVLSFVDTGGATETLRRAGILVAGLGVLWLLARSRRDDGSFVGAPRGRYTIHEGDRLVLYGRPPSSRSR